MLVWTFNHTTCGSKQTALALAQAFAILCRRCTRVAWLTVNSTSEAMAAKPLRSRTTGPRAFSLCATVIQAVAALCMQAVKQRYHVGSSVTAAIETAGAVAALSPQQ
jgi:hypothetical protein